MEFEFIYRFTSKAECDLDEILHYISVELSNPAAAKSLFGKIFESIDKIRLFPDSGLQTENEFLADISVKHVLIDNYVMYYKVIGKSIYILRIVYGKRNIDDILKFI